VLPEVVKEGVDGEKAVAYSELIPVLVEAVKELKTESDDLREENQSLRQRLEALERDGGR
jgi:FtsZ-binding cell division protein ZapB